MDEWGAMAVVWSGGLLVLVFIVAFSRRVRRHGGAFRAGVVGAMYDWLNRDRQKALEIIVEGKAAEKRPEYPDGNLPDLESPGNKKPRRDKTASRTAEGRRKQ